MTVEQALQILEQLRQAFNAQGADHDKIREALEVIKKALKKDDTKS